MASGENVKRSAVDWEAMAPDWRAGIKSVLQLSKEYSVSRAAILKHWEKEGVERDLSAKIRGKADALVTQALVTPEVTQKSRVTERQIVEANATKIAETELFQRANIQKAMDIVVTLWQQIEAEGDYTDEFRAVGEMMRSENDFGEDRLNDMYQAAIGLPQRVKNVKLLADALKVLIELQRKILKLDDDKAAGDGGGAFISLNDAQRASRIAFLIEKARGNG